MFNLGNSNRNNLSKIEKTNKYQIKDYIIDLNNKNDSHSIIVNSIKNSENSILDVGCGPGYIGKKIKELKKCDVDGIEIDKDALLCASMSYDKTYNFAIDNEKSKEYKSFFENGKKYDCIILADILEHLVDPAKAIFALYNKLKKNGRMIISIPNIAHLDVISGLIDGNFNYNKTGILDSTHLRFFTEKSFVDFIENVSEKYKINMNVSLLSKTYANSKTRKDDLLFNVIGEEGLVFQNIFEISKSKKQDIKIKKRNNHNKLNKLFGNYYNEIELLKRENQRLIEENMIIKKELKKILNSNSWKITKPLRIIKKATSRKRCSNEES